MECSRLTFLLIIACLHSVNSAPLNAKHACLHQPGDDLDISPLCRLLLSLNGVNQRRSSVYDTKGGLTQTLALQDRHENFRATRPLYPLLAANYYWEDKRADTNHFNRFG